jgi:hypothetical protein
MAAGRNIFAITTIRRKSNCSLADIIQLCSSFACSDHRDHVIAVLGLATDFKAGNDYLNPDYSINVTPDEIFLRYARWSIFEAESLGFLSLVLEPQNRPSWLPRLNTGALRSRNNNTPRSWSTFRATLESKPQANISADGLRLTVAGVTVDYITSQGSAMPLAPTMDEFSEGHVLGKLRKWMYACHKFYKDYFTGCLRLLEIEYTNPSHRYRYIDFIRTLIWDQAYQKLTIEQSISETVNYLHVILSGEEVDFESVGGGYVMTTAYNEGRRLCLTASGRMGYVPGATEIGDMVCLFYGGSLPYVIRPCGGGEYLFIGDCFLQGEMYGERMEVETETEYFTLI